MGIRRLSAVIALAVTLGLLAFVPQTGWAVVVPLPVPCGSLTCIGGENGRLGFASTDFVDWGGFGPPGTDVFAPSPMILSNNGLSVTVQRFVGGLEADFATRAQNDVGFDGAWGGNFGALDNLIFA